MKRISVEQVIKLHDKLVGATGGHTGVRDFKLLESALNNAYATFDGRDLYEALEAKCANICFCMVYNHPFIDGNKRIGLYVMLILLEYNEMKLDFSQDDLVDLGLGIANGTYKQDYIQKWIIDHKV
ncbi:MAG: death-on-curing protein [Clostridiales bacterium GWC2_40_7]|nr:MAG: death-on-curing protein [Clostridiales bacterium GWC2_40_7]